MALALTGCVGSPPASDSTDRLTTAIERADLGFTEVDSYTRTDGLTRVIGIAVAVDGTEVSAETLRKLLDVSVDAIDGDGFGQIALSVHESSLTGGRLPLWPALADAGFTQRPSESDEAFSQPLSTVRKVQGR